MSLSIKDYILIKVVQVSHQRWGVRYVVSKGIKCSYMSLLAVSLTLFKSPGLWNKFDLD